MSGRDRWTCKEMLISYIFDRVEEEKKKKKEKNLCSFFLSIYLESFSNLQKDLKEFCANI